MDQDAKDQVLRAMVDGLHAMCYGVYTVAAGGDPGIAMRALGDGGEIHEYVHAMLRLLPARCFEQVDSQTVCAHCKQITPGWSASEALDGWRHTPVGIEYHCYEAKVND